MRRSAMLAATVGLSLLAIAFAGCSDPASKLTSSNPDEVIQGIRGVAARGHETDVDLLVDMTSNADELIAKEAVRGIASVPLPKAVEALRNVAKGDKRETIRAEAVLHLSRKPDAETIALFRKLAKDDPGPTVRIGAVAGVGTQKLRTDIPFFLDIARDDGDVSVQARAVLAVEQITDMRFGYDARKSGPERAEVINRMGRFLRPPGQGGDPVPPPPVKRDNK